jgi:rubrerythrin
VSALQELYADEFRSRLTYLAYSEKALSDNYPAIAHLFTALAASDLVLLRNFTASLIDLGLEPKKPPPPRIQYLNTKENLNKALEMEITKIDQYPRFLDRIKGERHKETIRRIWYAVESEKKHSAYIRRIQNHAGLRFQFLAKYMETRPVRYYVCRKCGYTVIKLPHKACPVCERPVDYYKEVEMADLST